MSREDIDRDYNVHNVTELKGLPGEKRMSELVTVDVQLWIVHQQAAGQDTSAIDPLCGAVRLIVQRHNFPGHDRRICHSLAGMMEMQL